MKKDKKEQFRIINEHRARMRAKASSVSGAVGRSPMIDLGRLHELEARPKKRLYAELNLQDDLTILQLFERLHELIFGRFFADKPVLPRFQEQLVVRGESAYGATFERHPRAPDAAKGVAANIYSMKVDATLCRENRDALVGTIVHEMIHAYLIITDCYEESDPHGTVFDEIATFLEEKLGLPIK